MRPRRGPVRTTRRLPSVAGTPVVEHLPPAEERGRPGYSHRAGEHARGGRAGRHNRRHVHAGRVAEQRFHRAPDPGAVGRGTGGGREGRDPPHERVGGLRVQRVHSRRARDARCGGQPELVGPAAGLVTEGTASRRSARRSPASPVSEWSSTLSDGEDGRSSGGGPIGASGLGGSDSANALAAPTSNHPTAAMSRLTMTRRSETESCRHDRHRRYERINRNFDGGQVR